MEVLKTICLKGYRLDGAIIDLNDANQELIMAMFNTKGTPAYDEIVEISTIISVLIGKLSDEKIRVDKEYDAEREMLLNEIRQG